MGNSPSAVWCAVIAGAMSLVVATPAIGQGLELGVLQLGEVRASHGRLWLAIKNTGTAPRIVCRTAVGYSWVPDDPSAEGGARRHSSLDGCGDDEHDPHWLLKAGETRFDSYEIASGMSLNSALHVTVELEVSPLDGRERGRVKLSWSGTVEEARAAGSRLFGK